MDEVRSFREMRRGESAAGVTLGERYWKAAREDGFVSGKQVWHERAIMRFIQFLRPKRLTEVEVRDVTDWLRLTASPSASAGRRIRQASRTLPIPYRSTQVCTHRVWWVRD